MPDARPFRSLLVANRGEIAIRILRAGYELGLRTVALYTHEDRYSLHRYKADEAYLIGEPDAPLKPYLDIEAIVRLAQEREVEAIHPGYGFLSENVQFAERCRAAGIVFVGPTPEVMHRLGDKVRARALAAEVGLPLIEGNRQPLTDEGIALQEAERIGYPVILKAAAGGGGRGMRVVRAPEELPKAFGEARREAGNAFGDDTVFLEKFVERPKHIEVQLVGDHQGNLLHFYERDCSVQRRFQKVVEVAPAPNLPDHTRAQLYEAALKLGRAAGLNNAGTAEFLVDAQGKPYFIEVNPRIQVEHTVTEEVTGVDLVRTQLLVAMGESLHGEVINLPLQHALPAPHGFAIQCRVTTEDPEQDFRPDYGRIVHYRHAGGFRIRLDEGSTYPGATVSPFFDSMLVKITASGRSMQGACQRLVRTLSEFRIRGVKTNIPFLQNVIQHPDFQSGSATVNFIQDHPELLKVQLGNDRGTRMLSYLADVIVNGHPDVPNPSPDYQHRPAKVPACNRHQSPPPGTKQRLEALGREGFVQWLKATPEILFTDTTLRDAHQSLLATRVRTLDMLRVAPSLARQHPQLFSLEVWGGATFDVALRFLHECPWARLRALRAAIPNVLLQMLIRGANAVGYTAYPSNLVERFVERAAETGIDVFRIFDSLNGLENMRLSIQAVVERTSSLAEVCICYTGDLQNPDERKYTLGYYLDLARRIEDAGAHILAIKDMAGLLKPYAAEQLIGALREHIALPIHLHTHDTASIQSATYLKAIEAGVDVVDVALASMSGLTSQPNFNSVVAMLRGHARDPQLNVRSLDGFSTYWEDVRRDYYPFESGLQAGTAEVYWHEIPGGQYSNLRPQAERLGLGGQWETVKANYAWVNQLLGNIVKVTPSSKVVGDLALFFTTQGITPENLHEKGRDLSFPESVRGFLQGDLGVPEGGFPQQLIELVLKDSAVPTPAALPPIDFEQGLADFKARFGRQYTELDFISWCFYPKVFEHYAAFQAQYGDLSFVPTPLFFYGLRPEAEALVELEPGKSILVKYLYTSPPDARAYRRVYFELNGRMRDIEVPDRKAEATVKRNAKCSAPDHVGAPLQGKLAKLLIAPGAAVEKGTPLFVIEAMKMETTVTAPRPGRVAEVVLKEGTLVETDDWVLSLSA
ncbi:MAG: pyruvate carboxylase [Bacteroidia bacterium]|nr:pyruvate carboxylase [Bacteroidia bacterium]